MLRVHLVADDGEPLTMLVPVTADMRLDADAPEPWLFRGRWDGTTYYGEVRPEPDGATLHWSDGDHMETDLTDKLPIVLGRVVTVTSDEGTVRYTVRDVQVV